MFPASLINSCHTPPSPPPPPPPPTLPASLTPYPLACLTFLPLLLTRSLPLPGSPTSLSASLTPLFHSLCLIHSLTPCLIHSPTLLCLTQSLLTPLPPSFTFSSLSHCLTFPSLTFLPYSLPQSLPCLPHSLFLHSVIASLPPNSFLPYSLPQSLTAFLTYCLLLYFHSLPDSLTPLHPHLLTYLLHLIHSSSSLLVSLPVSFTPLHHSFLHPIPSHFPASIIHFFITQSLPHSPLPNSFLPLYPLHHSLSHLLLVSLCLIHSDVSPFTINSLVCLLLASFTP